ncbi:MAG: polysaccharide biosynthesis C-terminal domain-containing protein, partial [Bacteroidales bacterium]|nr:polysaccharide biosynthesis C-terminal domain-containing protein [Bacteroidales bacterium]
DKVMIGYFWTSVEVGYYFTVQQILQIFIILSAAVGTVLFPTLSEYHSSKNFERIKQTTHLTERYISMVLIPPIVIVILFAKPVINIMLNSAFLPASSVLIILTIYALIYGLRIPYHSLISGMNEPGIAARIGIAICATNIILNYLFIPECGLPSPFGISGPTGAAIATVLSSLVGLIGFQYTAKKLTGIRLFQSHTPRHILAGFVMAVVLYYSSFVVPVDRWYQLLGYSLYGLGIYLLVLFALKEFKKHDLNFFLNMLHPKEMFEYISSELRDKPKPPQ